MTAIDPLDLARALIAAPSVTPATGAVFDVLEAALTPLGFTVERFIDGIEPDGPVEILIAVRKGAGPRHFGFVGHLDVVPPGVGWTGAAFVPHVRGDMLSGRGAVDMKQAIAAFVAAAAATPVDARTISLIVTGDEEGPATFGTRVLMDDMDARAVRPDMILVGAPPPVDRPGRMQNNGRPGSATKTSESAGQGKEVAGR